MGFDFEVAKEALIRHDGNLQSSIDELLLYGGSLPQEFLTSENQGRVIHFACIICFLMQFFGPRGLSFVRFLGKTCQFVYLEVIQYQLDPMLQNNEGRHLINTST